MNFKTLHRSLLSSLVLLSSALTVADSYIVADPKTSWGNWEGWGISLCWWAKSNGSRDDLADLAFTSKVVEIGADKVPGLALNIVRYNAGASGSSVVNGKKMVPSPRISPSRQMPGFWLNPESTDIRSSSWDWTLDAEQRAMMQKAKARGADVFELFSNSPMWWMCTNNNPSGAESARDDNLRPEFYRAHAHYLAAVAKVAKDDWGINFRTVAPFNEPETPYWSANGTQEGCHFKPATQAKIIPLLREELDRLGLRSTSISASDETSYNQAASTWKSFDSRAKKLVSQVNVHGYQQFGKRDQLFALLAGKKIWNSEYGEEDASGKLLVKNLNLDMQLLHPSAWCYWQLVDGGGWGLVSGRRAGSLTMNQKYFILAQYTRHIRPGMRIIESGDMNTVMALDAKAKRLVIVTTNYEAPQTVHYYLNAFTSLSSKVSRWSTSFGSGDRYIKHDDLTIQDKSFACRFEPNCVQTFEIENVIG